MGPLAVVVVELDAEHAFEVAAVEDQQPGEDRSAPETWPRVLFGV